MQLLYTRNTYCMPLFLAVRGQLEFLKFSEDQLTVWFKIEIKPPLAYTTAADNAAFEKCDILMQPSSDSSHPWVTLGTISGHKEEGEFRDKKPVAISLERKTPLKWLNHKIKLKACVYYKGGRLKAESNTIDLHLRLPNLCKSVQFSFTPVYMLFTSSV